MNSRQLPLPARLGALIVLSALALGGCATSETESTLSAEGSQSASPDARDSAEEKVGPVAIEEIHALDIDAGAGVLRLATQTGVLVAPLPVTDEPVARTSLLGDRSDVVMAYVRLGTRLLVSGHPAPAEGDEPELENLGVWEGSTESGEWQVIALDGEVDFHTMTAAGSTAADAVVAGLDAVTSTVYVSPDAGLSWQTGDVIGATSLAFTANAGTLVAATSVGVFASTDRGRTFSVVEEAPALTLMATPPVGAKEWRIVGIDALGTLFESTDGLEWEQIGVTPVYPEALALSTDPDAIYLATTSGVSVTSDGGETFTSLLQLTP